MPRLKRPKSLTLGEAGEADARTLARALGLDEDRGSSAAVRLALSFAIARLEQALRHARRPTRPRRDAAPRAPKRWVEPEGQG
jgi:hypothetical protein